MIDFFFVGFGLVWWVWWVWFGLVWFGLVWFGLVWFGLVGQGKYFIGGGPECFRGFWMASFQDLLFFWGDPECFGFLGGVLLGFVVFWGGRNASGFWMASFQDLLFSRGGAGMLRGFGWRPFRTCCFFWG